MASSQHDKQLCAKYAEQGWVEKNYQRILSTLDSMMTICKLR